MPIPPKALQSTQGFSFEGALNPTTNLFEPGNKNRSVDWVYFCDMKQHDSEYPIYNYPDIFDKYFFRGQGGAIPCPDHALVFVISGELVVTCSCGTTNISEGGYLFLRRDPDTLLARKASDGKAFRSVFMGFNPCFLKRMHPAVRREKPAPDGGDFADNVIELLRKPSLESLYISLLPYLRCDTEPNARLLEIKLTEAVYSLIQADERFYGCLFDFDANPDGEHEPGQTLKSSYITLRNGGEVTDVYMDVTYRNVARFFNTFGQGLIFPRINRMKPSAC